MTNKKQPEALRLADELEDSLESHDGSSLTARCQGIADDAAAELRRLHAENETLTLYKSLADEYGLSIFKDLKDLGDAGSDVQLLRMGYAAARLEIESLKAQLHAAKQINAAQFGLLAASIPGSVPQGKGWASLPGQLPEPGKPVLLDIGKAYPIRAMWAAKHTVQAADDDPEWGEYVEADDMYYAPEGWYEWNQNEETHWRVSETPRAWRELPPTLPAAPGPAEG